MAHSPPSKAVVGTKTAAAAVILPHPADVATSPTPPIAVDAHVRAAAQAAAAPNTLTDATLRARVAATASENSFAASAVQCNVSLHGRGLQVG
jgi:hypothetical protein